MRRRTLLQAGLTGSRVVLRDSHAGARPRFVRDPCDIGDTAAQEATTCRVKAIRPLCVTVNLYLSSGC